MNDDGSNNKLIRKRKKLRELFSELQLHLSDFDEAEGETALYKEDMKFLSLIGLELLSLTSEAEIYDYILEKLEKLIEDSYIFIASYDKDSDSLKIKNLVGLNAKMVSLGEKIMGIKISELSYPMKSLTPEMRDLLSSGKLHRIENGLYYVMSEKVSKDACEMLTKAFSVGDTYVMGFSWEGEIFGSANILLKKGSRPISHMTVENFLNIASLVLQREQAEKELRERESVLSLVADNMLNVVSHVNSDGIFEYISPSVENVLGYDPEEIIGQNVFDFIKLTHPDDLEGVMSTFLRANISYLPGDVQHRFKCADGHYIWVKSLGNPLFDENKDYKGVVFTITDIDSLKAAEENLKSSLDEKNAILRELHHRVKNNMQIISSLLSLQGKYVKDDRDAKIFRDSQDRVKTLAMIHEELYSSDDFAHVNMKEHIQSLTKDLFLSYGVYEHQVRLKVNVGDIELELETAIPLGLIINELVTNSIKYAFPEDAQGSIIVELVKNGEGFILKVIDDGIGIPDDIDFYNADTLGFQLVNNLISQIDGDVDLNRDQGTYFTIKFKEVDYKARV